MAKNRTSLDVTCLVLDQKEEFDRIDVGGGGGGHVTKIIKTINISHREVTQLVF